MKGWRLPGRSFGRPSRCLTGDSSGILTFDFSSPTSVLEVDVALNTADALMPGFRVTLFDDSLVSVGETPVDVANVGGPLGF